MADGKACTTAPMARPPANAESITFQLAIPVKRTAFSVIFVKEVFGGTGFNILNVALVTRAFLFFAYPRQMSGDSVFVPTEPMFGFGGKAVDSSPYR